MQTSVAQSCCQVGSVLESRRVCVSHVAFVAKQFDRRDKVTVDTWRISLSLSPEGVDGSVLSCVPACSPVAVRRFKTTYHLCLVLVGFEPTKILSATGVGIFDRGRERHVRAAARAYQGKWCIRMENFVQFLPLTIKIHVARQ